MQMRGERRCREEKKDKDSNGKKDSESGRKEAEAGKKEDDSKKEGESKKDNKSKDVGGSGAAADEPLGPELKNMVNEEVERTLNAMWNKLMPGLKRSAAEQKFSYIQLFAEKKQAIMRDKCDDVSKRYFPFFQNELNRKRFKKLLKRNQLNAIWKDVSFANGKDSNIPGFELTITWDKNKYQEKCVIS